MNERALTVKQALERVRTMATCQPTFTPEAFEAHDVLAAALEERELLRRALEPFAHNLAITDPRMAGKADHPVIVRLVHLRQAKAALAKGEARNV